MNPIIGSVAALVTSVVSRIWPDKSEIQKQAFILAVTQELNETKLLEGQLEINKTEAAHANLFVAGWRPFIGWGLGSIIVFYAFMTLVVNFSIALGYSVIPLPSLDPMVRDIIMGMLGLNIGARTFEKFKRDTKPTK